MVGTKENQEFNTFFLTFAGQEVIITVDQLISHTNFNETGSIVETSPLFYEGILLDFDENYLYLGKTSEEINEAVSVKNIIHIMINDQAEVVNKFLEQMPIEGDAN